MELVSTKIIRLFLLFSRLALLNFCLKLKQLCVCVYNYELTTILSQSCKNLSSLIAFSNLFFFFFNMDHLALLSNLTPHYYLLNSYVILLYGVRG